MVSNVETAKRLLEDEVKSAPYTYEDPFSNVASYRKIIAYLYVSVVDDNIGREDAKAWLYDLYKNQSKQSHKIFCEKIDAIICAFEYLKMNDKI